MYINRVNQALNHEYFVDIFVHRKLLHESAKPDLSRKKNHLKIPELDQEQIFLLF